MFKTAMEKIVIVGAGVTGSFTSVLLRKSLPQNAKMTIIDKSRGTGGRMATHRSSTVESATVDLGAQYISLTQEYAAKHNDFHKELLSSGILQPLSCSIEGDRTPSTTKHYVAPKGSGSIVKHFLNQSNANMIFDEVVSSVDVDGTKVKVTCQSGSTEICDVLILTMPVPQILQLRGTIQELIDAHVDLKNKLGNVSYSSRFAVGLFYEPGTKLPFPWGAKYIADNPCVRFISLDSVKRNVSDSVGPSVTVHTSVPFSLDNLERDKEEMKTVILKHTKELFPELPEPLEVKGHKWRYSQVHKGFEGSPGCIVLSKKPLIVLAGDGFTHSNLDGCISSAISVHDNFTSIVGKL